MVKYKFVGGDLPELYKNKQDPLFHDGESWELAEGDGWVCRIEACGEVRLYKNGERLKVSDLPFEYETDDDLCKAESNGELEVSNNNWYEVQFFAETEHGLFYLDLTSDLVAYDFDECITQFKKLIHDKAWCKDLASEVAKIRSEYE